MILCRMLLFHHYSFDFILRSPTFTIIDLLLFLNLSSLMCSALQESPSLCLGRNASRLPPTLVFSCQVGVGRTNLAMILGTLVMKRLKGESQPPPQ